MEHRFSFRVGSTHPLRAGVVVASLLFAVVAALLSTRTFAADPAPCGASVSIDDVLKRLNAVRAAGKTCRPAGPLATSAPLTWSDSLATAALQQSREMATLNRMGHRDSANRNLGDRLRAQGYVFTVAAENVAVGYPSLEEVVAAWLESEGHCENLMSGAVLELGLACIDASALGVREERRYWTLVLAAPPKRLEAARTGSDAVAQQSTMK